MFKQQIKQTKRIICATRIAKFETFKLLRKEQTESRLKVNGETLFKTI